MNISHTGLRLLRHPVPAAAAVLTTTHGSRDRPIRSTARCRRRRRLRRHQNHQHLIHLPHSSRLGPGLSNRSHGFLCPGSALVDWLREMSKDFNKIVGITRDKIKSYRKNGTFHAGNDSHGHDAVLTKLSPGIVSPFAWARVR